nr:hypothetical protein [Tanacetum cinerariifolium]
MGDANPNCILDDYARPTHEGYRNTIELLEGNNVDGRNVWASLLKELTTSRAPKKVLIREEAKYPVTKNINSISLTIGEEEKNDEDDVTTDDVVEKTSALDTEMPVKKAKKENEAKNRIKNEPIKRAERE